MEGFVWYKDAIIIGVLFAVCVGCLLFTQWRANKQPKPRGATRV